MVVLRGWYTRLTVCLYGYFTNIQEAPPTTDTAEMQPNPPVEEKAGPINKPEGLRCSDILFHGVGAVNVYVHSEVFYPCFDSVRDFPCLFSETVEVRKEIESSPMDVKAEETAKKEEIETSPDKTATASKQSEGKEKSPPKKVIEQDEKVGELIIFGKIM